MHITLQACQAWTTGWCQHSAIQSLSKHRNLFPQLCVILHDFHFVGYQIARTLFIRTRRIKNAPYIGLCDCGFCTSCSPCGFYWQKIESYVDKIDDIARKLADDFELLDTTRSQVDAEMSACMFVLACNGYSSRSADNEDSIAEVLHGLNLWWRSDAVEMVDDLKALFLGLSAPVFGRMGDDLGRRAHFETRGICFYCHPYRSPSSGASCGHGADSQTCMRPG